MALILVRIPPARRPARGQAGAMTSALLPRERRVLAPGAVHVPDWLDLPQQRALVLACREWAGEGPGIRAAALPNGARMSVRTGCLACC